MVGIKIMKHYKNNNNQIYAYEEDGSQDHLIPDSFVSITDEEAAVLRKAEADSYLATLTYSQKRMMEYPSNFDFMEAYTEKEIGGDSTKWDAYVINYNKVRTENPK